MKFRLRRFLTSRVFFAALAALLLYTCGGYFLAPHVITWYIPKYLQENYACQASLGKVRLNPFLLRAEVNDFRLSHPNGEPLGRFSRLIVDAQLAGLFRKTIHARDFQLDRLSLHLIILPDGSLNVSALTPRPSPEKPEDNKPGSFGFLLDALALTNGEVTVTDRRQATPASWTLNQIDVQIRKLSTVEGENGSMTLQATTSEGETLDWQGGLTLTPLQSDGTIHLKGIRIASIWKYLKDRIHLDKPEGSLDIQTRYRLDTQTSPISLELENFQAEIREASLTQTGSETPFFRMSRFGIDSAQLDLSSRALAIQKILLDGVQLAISVDEDGRSNLEKIFPASPPPEENQPEPDPPPTQPAPATPEDHPWTVTAHAVEITRTACEITDLSRVEPLTAGVSGITVRSRATIEAGVRPWGSLQDLTIEADGIHGGIRGASRPLLEAGKLLVTGGEVHSGEQTLSIARVGLQDGHIDIGRNADGSLNWERLLAKKPGIPVHPEPVPDSDPSPPWKFRVAQVEVDRFQSEISDRMTAGDKPLLRVQDLSLAVSDIDGQSPMAIRTEFALKPGGKVSANGKLHPKPFSLEARVNLAEVDITPVQPYLAPLTSLTIESAAVSTNGVFRYEQPGKTPRISYAGNLGIANLRLNQPGSPEPFAGWTSLNIPQARLSLDPDKLDIDEIRLVEPTGELIIAEDGTLNWSRILRKPPASQGSEPSSPKAAPPPSTGSPSEPFSFGIGKITLEKGQMVFADQSLKPAFSTRIHDLRGSVGKLSSQKNSLSEIRLDGQVDEYGMAHISGALAVNDIAHSTDIRIQFRNVEMAGISPYSGKFAGRRIESGKISADLTYRIQTSKLVGDNQIIVDNLTLGERVDSPDAVNLPLDLAIALLSDADGRMDLGLPVSGQLNDPQFRIGPVIWKAFVNLISKVVTAPFRALGSLLGAGAEEFQAVEFEPGRADLLPPEREKLKKISEALLKRPRLQLVVRGQYSPDIDGHEWKQMQITRAVREETGRRQKPPVPPTEWEPLDFGDPEVQQALRALYEKKAGSESLTELEQSARQGKIKPRTGSGNPLDAGNRDVQLPASTPGEVPETTTGEQPDLLAGEMFARLVDSMPLSDLEMRQLANRRTQAIGKELRQVHALPENRLKISDSQALAGKDGVSADLSLTAITTGNSEGTVDSISR